MVCRECGTEIADKALICYRCGASTEKTAAAVRPTSRPERRRMGISLAALALLMLAGLFMGQVTTDAVPTWVSWTLGGLAVVLVIWWLARRGTR